MQIVTGERLQALLADVTVVSADDRAWCPWLPRLPHVCKEDLATDEDVLACEPLRRARRIMVYSHYLDWFLECVYPLLTQRFVLLTHNSDHGVYERHLPLLDHPDSKIVKWYAQNARVEHPALSPLPIGIANSQFAHGNTAALAAAAAANAGSESKTRLCYLNFSVATNPPLRSRTRDIVTRAGFAWDADRPYPEYVRYLAQHRFCVCPAGNGLDTHRLWECLYLGVVPVVRERPAGLPYERMPVLVLDAWEELSAALLERRFPELSARWREADGPWRYLMEPDWYAATIAADLSSGCED